MNIVLKQCHVADQNSPYVHQVKDVLIADGIIKSVSNNIEALDGATVVSAQGLTVSSGWVDVFASVPDPGYEFRETFATAADAACAGGYTTMFSIPNTKPVVDNKSQVEYVLRSSAGLPVKFIPVGALSKNAEGKELAEMYDMVRSGALAFSDGLNPVQSSALFLKALQYVRGFHGVVIQLPVDTAFARHGLMNEGIVSTRLGMPGIPSVGEELMIKRDIELVEYTRSKLHFTGVSTEKGLQIIADAKEKGLNVSCSVTPYHLYFCDEDLADYNTFLKVSPPLRTRKDMLALRKGVEAGIIDCIATHHMPHDVDAKQCEFEAARNGMSGLQTAFNVVATALPGLSEEHIARLFSTNARNIFNLPAPAIKEGEPAELTIFTRHGDFTMTQENNKSRSANSPFFNQQLKGRVIGTINNGNLYLN